jgi:hypothetical protein
MATVDNSRAWALIFIAGCFLAVGGFGSLRTLRFVLYAKEAQGVVVSSSERGDGQYMTFIGYPEVIKFSDSDGVEHTTTLYNGQPTNHRPGTPVKILYWWNDPARTARYGDSKQLWGLSRGFLLVGALWLFGAFSSWKRDK